MEAVSDLTSPAWNSNIQAGGLRVPGPPTNANHPILASNSPGQLSQPAPEDPVCLLSPSTDYWPMIIPRRTRYQGPQPAQRDPMKGQCHWSRLRYCSLPRPSTILVSMMQGRALSVPNTITVTLKPQASLIGLLRPPETESNSM
jgi:hypothetical protein